MLSLNDFKRFLIGEIECFKNCSPFCIKFVYKSSIKWQIDILIIQDATISRPDKVYTLLIEGVLNFTLCVNLMSFIFCKNIYSMTCMSNPFILPSQIKINLCI